MKYIGVHNSKRKSSLCHSVSYEHVGNQHNLLDLQSVNLIQLILYVDQLAFFKLEVGFTLSKRFVEELIMDKISIRMNNIHCTRVC